MTISYLYVGVLEQGDMQKGVSKGWCNESSVVVIGCIRRHVTSSLSTYITTTSSFM